MIKNKASVVVTTVVLSLFMTSGVIAETLDSIMTSASKAGSLSNGDGHKWKFVGNSDGWKVKGAYNKSAKVVSAGNNKIEIKGFPSNWGANGGYDFSRQATKCKLKSDHSRHKLEWNC